MHTIILPRLCCRLARPSLSVFPLLPPLLCTALLALCEFSRTFSNEFMKGGQGKAAYINGESFYLKSVVGLQLSVRELALPQDAVEAELSFKV